MSEQFREATTPSPGVGSGGRQTTETASKSRIEALSDAVIAVSMTLLVFNLHVPTPGHPGSLSEHLLQQWPNFAGFVVSFLTGGIIWVNHHAMLHRIAVVDHTILMLNLLLLLSICTLPFTTALIAEYLRAAHGEDLAAAIYGGSMLLMSIAFFVLQQHLLDTKAHLLHAHITPHARRAVQRRNAVGLLPYAVATLGALLSPYLTLAICAAVAGFYAAPSTTSDRPFRSRERRGDPAQT